MTRRRHVIEVALDFARMPALARSSVVPPIPPDIVEVMRIAAASPVACEDAAKVTGEPTKVLIEAARFYLQQLLLRPDADCHRILGLHPGASRAMARTHMRWLLQWLHPDRNDGLESVYAERVVQAWGEVSKSAQPSAQNDEQWNWNGSRQHVSPFRLPWIKTPAREIPRRRSSAYLTVVTWGIPGLLLVLLILWSAMHFFALGPTAAMVAIP